MSQQCQNASEVTCCTHVIAGQPADVLLAADDGKLEFAVCKTCADGIEEGNASELPFECSRVFTDLRAFCSGCLTKLTGISNMPAGGFWLRDQDGTYRPQLPA